MKINLDDPRLSAYAVGEMDEAERKGFETLLEADPEARAEVEQIREVARALQTELREEPAAAMSDQQRDKVMAAADKPAFKFPVSRAHGIFVNVARAAAVLIVLAGVSLLFTLPRSRTTGNLPPPKMDQLAKSIPAPVTTSPVSGQQPAPVTQPEPPVVAPSELVAETVPAAAETDKTSAPVDEDAPVRDQVSQPAPEPPPAEAPKPAEEEKAQLASVPAAPEASQVIENRVEVKPVADAKEDKAEAPQPAADQGSGLTTQLAAPVPPAPAPAAQTRVPILVPSLKNAPASPSPAPARVAAEKVAPSIQAPPPLLAPPSPPAMAGVEAAPVAGKAAASGSTFQAYTIGRYGDSTVSAPGMPPAAAGYGGGGTFSLMRTPGTEKYKGIVENEFKLVKNEPLSTFSIDVDTASYTNVRRFLNDGTLPPADAVRIEELINYFKYDYPEPEGNSPFSVSVEVHVCPWNQDHSLALIGLRGRSVPMNERDPVNLVFLIDVSGSMQPENKLPLLKKGLRLMVDSLTAKDRVGIVTYASTTGVALPSTSGADKSRILSVLDVLQAGGSTYGAGGIQLAYQMASENFIKGGINRIVLATDGDFNVGISDTAELETFIKDRAKTGIFLSVLGFGEGNLQDEKLEALADKGNGHYAYIDSFREARRVLMDDIAGTMVAIAKDVKIQIEFNPARVGAYRLIGYENRTLAAQDFNDDRKDAGEIGSGHTVTALYELAAPDKVSGLGGIDPLKYQANPEPERGPLRAESNELMTVKLRYKQPDGDKSARFDLPVTAETDGAGSANFKFASAVAMFGMLLRDSAHRGAATYDMALALAEEARGPDKDGLRTEFISLIQTARALAGPVVPLLRDGEPQTLAPGMPVPPR